jgi:hypothetical protein
MERRAHVKTIQLLFLSISILSSAHSLYAQGTAFTYQGSLNYNGNTANGSYDFRFRLDADAAGTTILATVTTNGVGVTNGLFVLPIDFGAGAFNGSNLWLEVAVRTNGTITYSGLTPLQKLTPAPYAVYAENANTVSGALPGSQLMSIGNSAGASGNFFVGPSGNDTMTGDENVGMGTNALTSNTTGHDNTANGTYSLHNNTTGFNNTAVGAFTMFNNTTGSNNTAFGYQALYSITTGVSNIAVGHQAGVNISVGKFNIDIGSPGTALDTNVIRIGNKQTKAFIAGTIFGDGGGLTNLNTSASSITSIGNSAGASGNFFVGPSGNDTMTGDENVGMGTNALTSNTTGHDNTANGTYSMHNNTTGFNNTAVGAFTMFNNTTGSNNTAFGYEALYSIATGVSNIAVGHQAGVNISVGSFNIDIGSPGTALDTNVIRIGNKQTKAFIAGLVNTAGGLQVSDDGTAISVLQAGQAIMPGSSTSATNFTITFPHPFTAVPKILVSAANDPSFPNVSDTFAVSVSSNSLSAFRVNVVRVDAATSWSQQLRINWQAWQ